MAGNRCDETITTAGNPAPFVRSAVPGASAFRRLLRAPFLLRSTFYVLPSTCSHGHPSIIAAVGAGIWNLEFGISLEFGVWSLEFGVGTWAWSPDTSVKAEFFPQKCRKVPPWLESRRAARSRGDVARIGQPAPFCAFSHVFSPIRSPSLQVPLRATPMVAFGTSLDVSDSATWPWPRGSPPAVSTPPV